MKLGGVTGIALAAMLTTGAGCHTTVAAGRVLTPDSERIIRDAQPRAPLEVVVPVGAERHADATLVRVLPTEAVVRVEADQREISVPTGTIRRVAVADHASGALKGAGAGLLAGAAAGVLLGAQAGSNDGGDTGFSRGTGMFLGGAVLGLVGAFVGTIVGGMRADVTTYTFD
jgi:hypothetical protein